MMALRPPFGTAPNLEACFKNPKTFAWRMALHQEPCLAQFIAAPRQALVNRIVRADVTLPEHLTHDYPEASRCTRAMLRQQPDRRPTAHSLLNRPRLQPPGYDLPGMHSAESPSTPSTPPTASIQLAPPYKAFEPPGRTENSQASKQKLVAAQAAVAAANAAVKAAALSPRTRGRAKLANQILEAESEGAAKVLEECTDADRPCHRAAGQKGVITDVPLSGRSRRQANAGFHGNASPAHPTYPASPSVAISTGRPANTDGANVRSCSGDVRPRQPYCSLVGQPQPLSARQKAGCMCAAFFWI